MKWRGVQLHPAADVLCLDHQSHQVSEAEYWALPPLSSSTPGVTMSILPTEGPSTPGPCLLTQVQLQDCLSELGDLQGTLRAEEVAETQLQSNQLEDCSLTLQGAWTALNQSRTEVQQGLEDHQSCQEHKKGLTLDLASCRLDQLNLTSSLDLAASSFKNREYQEQGLYIQIRKLKAEGNSSQLEIEKLQLQRNVSLQRVAQLETQEADSLLRIKTLEGDLSLAPVVSKANGTLSPHDWVDIGTSSWWIRHSPMMALGAAFFGYLPMLCVFLGWAAWRSFGSSPAPTFPRDLYTPQTRLPLYPLGRDAHSVGLLPGSDGWGGAGADDPSFSSFGHMLDP